MPFTFRGDQSLTYPQYLNLASSHTLVADPGVTYDLAAAGGLNLAVPPADGLWEDAGPDGGQVPPGSGGDEADGGKAALLPPPLMTGTSTEGEEN